MKWLPFQLLMPGGKRAKHQVLIFHRVLGAPDQMMPSEPCQEEFDLLVGTLKRFYNILPLSDAIERVKQGTLPSASLSITFDDGYADNYTHALPILERHEAPATFFVATAFLDGGRMWNDTLIETARRLPDGEVKLPFGSRETSIISSMDDRRSFAQLAIDYCKYLPISEREERASEFAALQNNELPTSLMMSSEQVRTMATSDYAEIGAHTRNHPILAECNDQEAEKEIADSVRDLTHLLGRQPKLFAYPNGKLNKDYLQNQTRFVVKAGLKAAVTTDWGVLDRNTDLMQIPRFSPWKKSPKRFVFDLLRARYGIL